MFGMGFLKHGKALLACAAIALSASSAKAEQGATLKTVKERGQLLCGAHPGRYGFAAPDAKGRWVGFEVDLCRAIAAAIFGDGEKVKFVALSSQQRFPAIQSGEVDVLPRNTTATLTRDTALGLNFSPPVFYTGLGFLVRKDAGVKSIEELNGAVICMAPSSTTEQSVARIFAQRNLKYTPIVIENNKELASAYVAGRCDALAKDRDALPGVRVYDAPNPDDHVILDGTYSKEPLALAVRHGDDQWYDIVKWVMYGLMEAEENGISQANADTMLKSSDPYVRDMLGVTGDFGAKLGLDNKWLYSAVKSVGSYKDIYERHFGAGTPLPLPRGVNKPWTDGGLLYGLPIK